MYLWKFLWIIKVNVPNALSPLQNRTDWRQMTTCETTTYREIYSILEICAGGFELVFIPSTQAGLNHYYFRATLGSYFLPRAWPNFFFFFSVPSRDWFHSFLFSRAIIFNPGFEPIRMKIIVSAWPNLFKDQ